jgi:hypothetical protein
VRKPVTTLAKSVVFPLIDGNLIYDGRERLLQAVPDERECIGCELKVIGCLIKTLVTKHCSHVRKTGHEVFSFPAPLEKKICAISMP